MKYIFLTLFILVQIEASFAQTKISDLKADSIKLYIEYARYENYLNDSIFGSLGKGLLFLGNKGSVYTWQTQPVDSFFTKLGKSIENDKIRDIVVEGFRRQDMERNLTTVMARFYDRQDYLVLKASDDWQVWLSETSRLKFIPVDSFRTIAGYRCQQAIAKSQNGGAIYAWFTVDIPISSGPSNAYGLPGMVLEYYYPGGKMMFRAVKISSENIPAQNYRKWLVGPIVDKEEYKNYSEMNAEKLKEFKKMMESDKREN